MNRIRFMYYLSILILIAAGVSFVKANRYGRSENAIEVYRDKTYIFYSSNFKRLYINSSGGIMGDLEKLCAEGADNLMKSGLDSTYYRIEEGTFDPYTQAGAYLSRNLVKGNKFVLIDINRNQAKHGSKYDAGDSVGCPISIILSKKSGSYDSSLLFAGRIKAVIDKKYKDLPVHIIESPSGDYNQSMGYIGLLVEIGDAANSFKEAERSLKILCEAIKEVAGLPY